MESRYVLGVRVDNADIEKAMKKAGDFMLSGQHKIFTPNPEMIVKAQTDEYFKAVLNCSDLNLCDGYGLYLFSGMPRVTGVDFMTELAGLAAKRGNSVYFLGSATNVICRLAAENLKKKYPDLIIAGYDKGPQITEEKDLIKIETGGSVSDCIQKINIAKPDILFVAFGMGKQEKWIYENLANLPSVKIAVGIGGSFDYISGKINRAPLFLRKIGLEWMYRLSKEPKRTKRIYNAVFRFPFLIIKSHIFGSERKSD